jgi:hypothetical protein
MMTDFEYHGKAGRVQDDDEMTEKASPKGICRVGVERATYAAYSDKFLILKIIEDAAHDVNRQVEQSKRQLRRSNRSRFFSVTSSNHIVSAILIAVEKVGMVKLSRL